MPETKEKQCPFNSKLECEDCRLFISVAGQQKECQVSATARQLFMIYAKGSHTER